MFWRKKKLKVLPLDHQGFEEKEEEKIKEEREEEEGIDKQTQYWINIIDKAYRSEMFLEEMKEESDYLCEESDGKFKVFQKICEYGGCYFEPELFNTEYEAYRHNCIVTALNRINGSSSKNHRRYVNRGCENYRECSGIDY